MNDMRKLMEAVKLNEYLIRNGDTLSSLLKLNLFQDILGGGEEVIFYDEDEGDYHAEWKPVVEKYEPIARQLYKRIKHKGKRELSPAEVEAAEACWYDGGDAYGWAEEGADWLPEIYDNQIEVVEAILNGDIVDDDEVDYDEVEEGIVGNALSDVGRRMSGRVLGIDQVRALAKESFSDILRYATLLEEEAIDPVKAGKQIREYALEGIRAVHVKQK